MSRRAPDSDQAFGLGPSQRRLQRPPDFTGGRLRSFHEVALRHGLPGALLGVAFLLHPEARTLLLTALAPALEHPLRSLAIGAGLLAGLLAYARFVDGRLDLQAAGWILYLLLVSVWEEWVFRVALPDLAEARGLAPAAAVTLSNVAFGAAHYFTLRWKWQWCAAATLGGFALSRQFAEHGDLAMLVGLHWLATFLNTPRTPGRMRNR